MADIQAWWKRVPPVTKTLAATSLGLTLAVNFRLMPAHRVIYDASMAFQHWQLWRPLTALFVWPLGFGFLVEMFMLLRHSQQLEQVEFLGRTADYLWMLLLALPPLWLGAWLFRLPLLGASFVMVILYVWARKFPEENMTFMFGLRFKSKYLPWVLLAFHVLMGGSPWADVLGIAVGHLYWFAVDVLPHTHNLRLVKTPGWLTRFVPNAGPAGIRFADGGFDPRPLQARPPEPYDPRRHNWGVGHQLGGGQ